MHNTLVASEYSLIEQSTLTPKPNYWAAYLWAKLMGTDVLDVKKSPKEGVYVFAHSTKGSKNGVTFTFYCTFVQRCVHSDIVMNEFSHP